jgi:alkaline phosphatase
MENSGCLSLQSKFLGKTEGKTMALRSVTRLLICVLFLANPCASWSGEAQPRSRVISENARPRNIILMIGDGMGISAVTAGKVAKGKLALEGFPVGGFVTTWSEDGFVTDSAAGATAYATGKKTRNGRLSIAADGVPLRTIVEEARARGMKTGVIATSTVTHATPAAFLAHHEDRYCEYDIAGQEAASGVDLLMGGGRKLFRPYAEDVCEDAKPPCEKAAGEKDLIVNMKKDGYCYLRDLESFDGDCGGSGKLLALLAECEMDEAPGRKPALAEMTGFAIDFLSNVSRNRGFFLMIEGSQIDWAGQSAYAFAKERGDTLLVVTSDHETGGYAVTGGDPSKGRVTGKYLSGGKSKQASHTAQMVPLFASGPGSAAFGGIHDNTEIGGLLFKLLAIGPDGPP